MAAPVTAEQLAGEFAPRGVVRGAALLLPLPDALDLVRRARAARLPVAGIDAFDLSDAGARHDLANSIDFIGASCRTNPWAEAEAFLEERDGSTLHFAVALGG